MVAELKVHCCHGRIVVGPFTRYRQGLPRPRVRNLRRGTRRWAWLNTWRTSRLGLSGQSFTAVTLKSRRSGDQPSQRSPTWRTAVAMRKPGDHVRGRPRSPPGLVGQQPVVSPRASFLRFRGLQSCQPLWLQHRCPDRSQMTPTDRSASHRRLSPGTSCAPGWCCPLAEGPWVVMWRVSRRSWSTSC